METKSRHTRNFAEIVVTTRLERMLTQADVADELGVHKRTVQNWEAGMTPAFRHQRALIAWASPVEEAVA